MTKASNRSTAVQARRLKSLAATPLLNGGGQMTDKPSGHSAVMAMRAPGTTDGLDYFPTPPWAARAGGELIKRFDPMARSCWEPACGEGHMAHGLSDYFEKVTRSDVHDYGVGAAVHDFVGGLAHMREVVRSVGPLHDWIVTNPPFNLAGEFVERGLQYAEHGVAVLVRLAFLEGQKRHLLLHGPRPVRVVSPFAERVPMVKDRWDPEASSATAYAWFLWAAPGAAWAAELPDAPILAPIPPGSKMRLSRREDLERFAPREPGSLL
jgi:hypothetical protein